MINGTRNVAILSDEFFQRYNLCQMCVNVNDSLKDNMTNGYNFNDSKIIKIEIKWNNDIVTTYNMLKDCYRIIKIDLSNFNTSQIYNMTKYLVSVIH